MKHIENQLILPLNLEIKIPNDDSVNFLNDILEQLNYSKLFSSYQRTWRKFNPKTLCVESEYIVGIGSYTNRTDVNTLIPFLENIKRRTTKTYINVIADSGYENEENYMYLESNNQTSYIKPTNYEI